MPENIAQAVAQGIAEGRQQALLQQKGKKSDDR
jgi:hypothetical protein